MNADLRTLERVVAALFHEAGVIISAHVITNTYGGTDGQREFERTHISITMDRGIEGCDMPFRTEPLPHETAPFVDPDVDTRHSKM